MQSHDSTGLIRAVVNHAAADFFVVLIHDLNDFAAKEVSDHSFNTDRQQALAFADSLDGTLINNELSLQLQMVSHPLAAGRHRFAICLQKRSDGFSLS